MQIDRYREIGKDREKGEGRLIVEGKKRAREQPSIRGRERERGGKEKVSSF